MNKNQNFFDTTTTTTRKSHGKYLDTITPVLISWLISKTKDMKEDYIEIDNYSCDKFSIIGRINSFIQKNNKFCLTISDGTGQIEVICIKKYEDNLPFCLKDINFKKKIYVRGVIDISTYNIDDVKTVIFSGLSFIEVKNYDFITFHFLETFAFRNYRKNGFFNKNNIMKPSNNKKLLEKIDKQKNEDLTEDGKDDNDKVFDDEEIQDIVFKIIKSIKSKTHIHVTYKKICEALKNVDKIKIDNSLSNLNEEGLIYVVPGSKDSYDFF